MNDLLDPKIERTCTSKSKQLLYLLPSLSHSDLQNHSTSDKIFLYDRFVRTKSILVVYHKPLNETIDNKSTIQA